MVSRVIAGETILLPIYKTSDEINCIYSLNKAASWLWERVDGKKTVADIEKEILKSFEITEKEAKKHCVKLFKEMEEIKAIK